MSRIIEFADDVIGRDKTEYILVTHLVEVVEGECKNDWILVPRSRIYNVMRLPKIDKRE